MQESELRLKESLCFEAAARRSRLRMRVAGRVAENAKRLREAGCSDGEIAVAEAEIRAAGEVEERALDEVRIRFARNPSPSRMQRKLWSMICFHVVHLDVV